MSRHHARLSRKRWERTRLQVLDRDGYRCRRCGRAGRMEVHHVRPLQEAPDQDPYDPAGCEALCLRCHGAAHRSPDPARARWRALIARFDEGRAKSSALAPRERAYRRS